MPVTQDSWLTTLDNPFDPFTQFDEWYQYDTTNNYNTCGYIARIAKTSTELSDEDYNLEVERAIDEIIKFDPLDIYIRVKQKEKELNRITMSTL